MEYWISGYLLGMLATATVMGWGNMGDDDITPGAITLVGIAVVLWPPALAVIVSVWVFMFFDGLFSPAKPKPVPGYHRHAPHDYP